MHESAFLRLNFKIKFVGFAGVTDLLIAAFIVVSPIASVPALCYKLALKKMPVAKTLNDDSILTEGQHIYVPLF
jgi:hypothetical protein